MSDWWTVHCVNCGEQTTVDLKKPDDTCLFCGKIARKKEVIMVETKQQEREPVPRKPKYRSKLQAYWNEHREAIIADYLAMKFVEFLTRWHMATTTWSRLKTKWEVPSKGRGDRKTREPKKPSGKITQKIDKEYREPQPKLGEFCILITEEDLTKLDDDDFRLAWVILGRIIKNRLK